MTRIVVVGHGMAGARLVDDLLSRGVPGERIAVVGAEPYGAYNRVLLSEVVAGRADVAALHLADPDTYRRAGVRVHLGTAVTGLDLSRRRLTLHLCPDAASTAGTGAATVTGSAPGHRSGTDLEPGTDLDVDLGPGTASGTGSGTASGTLTGLGYDHLVLATGAAPVRPDVPGLDPQRPPAGVHALRTVDDCREIVAAASTARRVVVVGGGLLGLEAARGLAGRGLPVDLLGAGAHLLERQLDAPAGAVVARGLRRLGVRVLDGFRLSGLRSAAGHVTAVRADGPDGAADLPADLVVLACGVRPRTGLARTAGLRVGRGIVVDGGLGTSDPAVSAIGDCAEFDGELPGLVAPAWEQARVLADRLAGTDRQARYRGHRSVFRLKADGLDVLAAGQAQADPWTPEPGLDVVQLIDPGAGRYVKAVLRDGHVVGAISVGHPRAAAELALLVERRAPAPHDRATLLLPGAAVVRTGPDDPTLIPDRATVCRCNGVTKGAIVRAWTEGARDADRIASRTRAGTGCGSCRSAVEGLVDWLAAADPDPSGPVPGTPDRAATDPARTAPPIPGPGTTGPATTQPAADHPATTRPAPHHPAATDRAATDRTAVDPVR